MQGDRQSESPAAAAWGRPGRRGAGGEGTRVLRPECPLASERPRRGAIGGAERRRHLWGADPWPHSPDRPPAIPPRTPHHPDRRRARWGPAGDSCIQDWGRPDPGNCRWPVVAARTGPLRADLAASAFREPLLALVPSPHAGWQLPSLGSLPPGEPSFDPRGFPFPFIMRPKGENSVKKFTLRFPWAASFWGCGVDMPHQPGPFPTAGTARQNG